METFKKTLLTFLQVCLWLTFLVAIGDSMVVTGTRPPTNMYAGIGFILDWLYSFTNIITSPVQIVFIQFGWYNPQEAVHSWFPVTSAADLGLKTKFFVPVEGGFIWWIPITSLLLYGASKLFDYCYESIRNTVWNLIVEYVFHRKKAKIYEEALTERNADLARLDVQYRTLAQETHTLKDTVITDELTKVYNKRFFMNRLQLEFDACMEQRALLSIIMIDIDFFKRLNDTYGHLAGDQVLQSVAAVIKRFTPELCYPCRYGGEEFSIILPRKNLTQAIDAARLIQDNMQMLHFDNIDKKMRVTVSQGICTVDFANPETRLIKKVDSIMEMADKQLYRSKMEGRNRVSSQMMTGPLNPPNAASS